MNFDELFYNIDHGYLEGLVRGFRGGVLSQADYTNLVQCETLEGNTWKLSLMINYSLFVFCFVLKCYLSLLNFLVFISNPTF